jgi:hypothetical protein
MKKISAICIVLAVLSIMCGCDGNNMFEKPKLSNETIVNGQMDALLAALECRDTEGLISLFAPKALNNTENIQHTVDLLYSYYQGKHISYDNWNATGESTERNDNHVVKKLYGTYDVVTDEDTYRFAFLYVAEDSSDPDNVGLQSVYIIKRDDDIDPQYAYRGDQAYKPGIHIGVQNKLPDEVL